MNDLKTRVEETKEQGEGETQLVLAITAAAALGGLGFWLYRRSQTPAPALTMMDPAHLAQLPAPEEEEIILPQLGEEEIRLAQLEEKEEEEIHLAKLSLRERRRQGGGITIL